MALHPLVVMAATLTLASVLSMQDDDMYCAQRYARLCQGKGLHVGCRYPFPGPGDACENYAQVDMDSAMRMYITDYINKRRQKVATGRERVRGGARIPKPDLMMLVEWDRELALLAQRLADQCTFVHDECRATVRYPYAGQSVGEVRIRRTADNRSLDAMTLKAIRRVLDAWWGERRRVETRQLFQPFRVDPKGAVWGHFSQLVVWSLRAVGCGAARHGSGRPRMLLVCDFSHTNMLGERTLRAGPQAACPQNTERRARTPFFQLCALRIGDREHKHRFKIDDFDDDETTVDTSPTSATKTRKSTSMTKGNISTETFLDSTEIEELKHPIQRQRYNDLNPRNEDRKYSYMTKIDVDKTLDVYDKEDNYIEDGLSYDQYVARRMTSDLGLGVDIKIRSDTNNLEDFRKGRKMMEEFGQIPRLRPNVKYEPPEQFATVRLPKIQNPSTEERRIRKKWQRQRHRPNRPGAAALFTRPQGRFYSRTARVSLMLDKDDHDQFFKDTGFSITLPEDEPNQNI